VLALELAAATVPPGNPNDPAFMGLLVEQLDKTRVKQIVQQRPFCRADNCDECMNDGTNLCCGIGGHDGRWQNVRLQTRAS
jgi:hypothetical protein